MEDSIKELSRYRFECSKEAFIASKEDAEKQIERAKILQDTIKDYLEKEQVI